MAYIMQRRWKHGGEVKTAWQVDYRDPTDGKRRRRQFRLREAAERFHDRAELAEQMARAERPIGSSVTVPDPASPVGYRKAV